MKRADWLVVAVVFVLLMVGFGKFLDAYYSHRCANLGGEWQALRGCKVMNVRGEPQWVRP